MAVPLRLAVNAVDHFLDRLKRSLIQTANVSTDTDTLQEAKHVPSCL